MKLEIFESEPEPKEPEKIMKLNLIENDRGGISVVIMDDGGNIDWYLARITSEGIRLDDGLDRELGFNLDEHDRLKLIDE